MKRLALALLFACGGRLAVDAPEDHPAPISAPSQPAFPSPPPGTRAASPHAAADASDDADFDAGSAEAACAPDGAVVGGEGCHETDPSPRTHVACCTVRGDVLCCVSPRDAGED